MEINLPKNTSFLTRIVVVAAYCYAGYILTDIHGDIKHLMAESNINKTKIENIETRINNLEKVAIFDKLEKSTSNNKKTKKQSQQLVFIKKEDDDDKKWLANL